MWVVVYYQMSDGSWTTDCICVEELAYYNPSRLGPSERLWLVG